MHFVYSIKSELNSERYYVGITTDPHRRLEEHNARKSIHTNKFKPWKLEVYIAFSHKEKAEKFETYLKTGSGRAFCERHFS